MKLTQGQLKKIIREEAAKLMERGPGAADQSIGSLEGWEAKKEGPEAMTEESADEREDTNIDSLWRYVRQNRSALNKLLPKDDRLKGEREGEEGK